MEKFCPHCSENRPVQRIVETVPLQIGDRRIPTKLYYFACKVCGGEWEQPDLMYDPLAWAYQEYQRITGKKWTGNNG